MLLVIGYGSKLHSDDSFGRIIAEKLQEQMVDPSVETLSLNQLTPECAETISRASSVVFVDASTLLPPGELSFRRIDQSIELATLYSNSSTHHCQPEVILQLCLTLYGRMPRAWLCTIGAESLALGESLSPCIEAGIPEVMSLLLELSQC